MRTPRLALLPAILVAGLGGSTPAFGTAATSTAVICRGQPATLVAEEWSIRGTSDPELVHVTFSGGTSFYGLGGDDRFLGSHKDPDLFDGGDGVDRYLGLEKRNNTCLSVQRDPQRNCRA
jgi:hypothetical protein